jgi:SAM-dependent methyltransferase
MTVPYLPDSAARGLSPLDDIANTFSVDEYLFFHADALTGQRSDDEANAVVRLMEMDRPMRILDLACGYGRIANRLALVGHHVTGIEYLAGFLELARQAARKFGLLGATEGGSVRYHLGDMRRIEYQEQFERVILVFNSFGYFPDAENFDLLRRIARALVPGGLLGFDVAHRDGLLASFQPHSVVEKEGRLMVNRFSFDVQTGRLHNDRIILHDGRRVEQPFSIRLYAFTELRDLLARAGLVVEQVYGEWDARPLELESPAMVIIARKTAVG